MVLGFDSLTGIKRKSLQSRLTSVLLKNGYMHQNERKCTQNGGKNGGKIQRKISFVPCQESISM